MQERLIDIQHPVTVCRASAGTGKTYTLAAYYVGLLLSGEDYRSILAITFTNKATAEMRERIMTYLYGIANGGEEHFLERAKQFMLRHADDTPDYYRRRAAECFRRMLLDYDNVQVQTIDSFLQTLLAGLAGVLRTSAGFSTELDVDHVIRQAVDQLLTTDLTQADKVIIEDYMRLKLDSETQWDVRQSLCAMAKEMYNESVQMLDANGQILFDTGAIAQRRKLVNDLWAEDERVKELGSLLQAIHTEGLVTTESVVPRPLPHVKDIDRACERLRNSLDAPEKVSVKDRFRGLTETQLADAKAGKWTKIPAHVVENIVRATELAKTLAHRYNTLQLTIRFSRDMELMGSLESLIQRNLAEANSALLAQTAATLTEALRQGDADFILEKAGIRYRHVLIDEFQDTSRLQWSVIKELLTDLLAAEGNTLLIVGDIKQSIYRWRNGDWHIMDGLDYPQTNDRFTSLTRNFRSTEKVVQFNLSLFRYIVEQSSDSLAERIYSEGFTPGHLDQYYQADKKRGGFVRFRAFPKGTKEQMALDMFAAMEELLEKGAEPADMMILVREKKDAAFITSLKNRLPEEEYPRLLQTAIVSADSFLLEASDAVKTVIASLRVIAYGDEVAAKYIEIVTEKPGVIGQIKERVGMQTPLFEAVNELVGLLLIDSDGRYPGTETAYINSLLDRTRDYVSSYGSNLQDFLTYWDDTLHAKSIPASSGNAIRILTVHASKGLQAQTLFVPFCTWTKEAGKHAEKIWCQVAEELPGNDYVPVTDGAEMADSAYKEEYDEEHLNMRIDNLNMLYVALTRAEDNLYLSADFPVTAKGTLGACNHVGRYLLDYTGLNEQILREDLPETAEGAPYAEYAEGTPLVSRHVLSDTTGRQDKPFSFSTAETHAAELWADSRQVRFVQSQEGALYTGYGDDAYRRVARMDFGNLCHEIFAHLRKADELDRVLDDFQSRGEIKDDTQRETLRALISSAWEGNGQMRDWFTSPWELRLEEAIYIDHRELRPDRVMINPLTKEAIVLDYKFGQWDDKYISQVNEYKEALSRMGYSPVRGYLWFARKPQGKQLVAVSTIPQARKNE